MAHTNKDEVRIYYETHRETPKSVAKEFGISYRTLMNWIKAEGWEKGGALRGVESEVIKSDLIAREFGSVMDAAHKKIKNQLRENLGENAYRLNELVLNNLLDSTTDEILLGAMGSQFLQKKQTLAVMMAQDELQRMEAVRDPLKPDPMFIACAEKTAKMTSDLHADIYGKESTRMLNDKEGQDLTKLSDGELKKMLASLKAGGA